MNSLAHSSLDLIQPAQTGGAMTSCELGRGTRLVSRHFLLEKVARPRVRRFGSRVLLSSRSGAVVYVGRNGGSRCETCGAVAVGLSKHLFDEKQWLLSFCLALARKRYHKRNGGTCVKKAEEYATGLAKIVDRFAAVLAETVAVKGDAATIDHYQAVVELMAIV